MLALCLAPAIAVAKAPADCGAPADLHDGWKVAAPAQEGLDPKLICAIGPRLEKMTDANPNGVVVVRHGALVYEHYFVGGIEYGADTLHGIRSITKSVVALLVGIAFDRGWVKSLDTPVFSFFPEDADLRTPDKDRITLRDLLTMTSGLQWPESAISYNNPLNLEHRMDLASRPYRFVLEQSLAAMPGMVWNYNSGGVEILGNILIKVSRQPLVNFAKQALFDPLGIRDWEWARSPNGKRGAAWGLWLRLRDLAKIGQLVLNHGAWQGRQIVSAAWIKQMTAPRLPRWYLLGIDSAYSYGYLWWLGRSSVNSHQFPWAAGFGWGGQRLYVVPSQDLVVAVTAGVYRRSWTQNLAGDTALDMVLRAALGH